MASEAHGPVSTAVDDPDRIEDLTFHVGDAPQVVVRSFNGRVNLRTGGTGVVRTQATIRNPSRVAYGVSQSGNTVTVQAIGKSEFSLFGSAAGVDLVITAPAATTLDVQTSNGRVQAEGFTQGGVLVTSNSKVELARFEGDLSVKTSNGKVQIDRFSGTGQVKTSNGAIILERAKGTFDVETSNGKVTFVGEMKAGGTNRFKTSNGDVAVVLRGKPSVQLDASTSNGGVESGLPIMVTTMERSRLVGAIGDGEAKLEVHTSNGYVTVK